MGGIVWVLGGIVWVLVLILPWGKDLSIPMDPWVVLFVFGCEITLCRRFVCPYRPMGGIFWVLGVRIS